MTRFKVCCIASLEEAQMAIAAGADAVGLVSQMPSGPGPIPDSLISEIAASIPPGVSTFLLTALTDGPGIADHARRCKVSAIQLVDVVAEDGYAHIRRELPAVKLIQVVHVTGPQALEEARRVAPLVDAVLLDSGRPDRIVKELGGTGRVHDWTVSRRVVESIRRPVFLAGGLTPSNVAEAIRAVRPFGVDACSGLRSAGKLDPAKLRAFAAAVQSAEGPASSQVTK